MAGRRNIRDELRRVADDYVQRHPADLAKVRAVVERRRRRRQVAFGGGALAVAAASALLFFTVSAPNVAAPEDIKPAESPDASVPEALRITKEIALGVTPTQVASGEGVAYVTSSTGGQVLKVDLEEAEVVEALSLGAPEDVINDGVTGNVWVTAPGEGTINRLSAKSLQRTGRPFSLQNGDAPVRLTVTGSTLRVSGETSGVVKVDLLTEEQTPLLEEDIIDIAATGGEHFWVLTATGEIKAIDSGTGADIGLPPTPVEPREDSEITFAKEAIWYGVQGDSTMTRIDNATGESLEFDLPGGYWDLDADRNGLWVLMRSSEENGVLADIDPTTGAPSARVLRLDGQPVDIATSGDGIWVVKARTQSIIHINDAAPGEL